MTIDIGSLTEEETKALAIECLNMLSFDVQMQVLNVVFQGDMRAEVASQLEDDPDED